MLFYIKRRALQLNYDYGAERKMGLCLKGYREGIGRVNGWLTEFLRRLNTRPRWYKAITLSWREVV